MQSANFVKKFFQNFFIFIRGRKMKLMFLQAKYGIDFKIPENFLKDLKHTFPKGSNLAVFCAVQFRNDMDKIMELLNKEGYTTQTSKAFRTSIEGQLLGCDSYADSLELDLSQIDGFLYVGDGYFHPNALLLAQEYEEKIKPVFILNMPQQITEIIDKKHIEKYLKKKKANLARFHMSDKIGVFVTTKWGQEYMESGLKLKEKYKNKTFYYFIGDNFNDYEMSNFPYIECWVNTACPRIGQDDIVRHEKPVINIKDIW